MKKRDIIEELFKIQVAIKGSVPDELVSFNIRSTLQNLRNRLSQEEVEP